jgi:hypothetical protein
MQEVCRMVGAVLTEWQAVTKKMPAFKAHAAALQDIEAQLKRLMGKTLRGRNPVRAPAALPALLQGDSGPARQTEGRSDPRCAPWPNTRRYGPTTNVGR